MAYDIFQITYLVRDYDEAISYFVKKLGFILIEDTRISAEKRWVIVATSNSGFKLLLAKVANDDQKRAIGFQAGGRVAFFLKTDDFNGTYAKLKANGVNFIEEPRHEEYGPVVVFEDIYSNKWDLIGPKCAI
jgi:catechol 2,3-dioxygenase-like lactoylglutathione lyase family enzyme